MIFNTIAFAKFFAFVFVVSWLLSSLPKARFYFITAASYVFYSGLDIFGSEFWSGAKEVGAWESLKANAPLLQFVPIVFIGSTVDYFLSLAISGTEEPRKRKALLLITIAMNTGLLLVFKYWDFLAEQVIALGGHDYRLHLPLPVGISFFTFMSLSFVIDVYRREIPPCRNYAHYITYIGFFPHLVAGPIIRGRDLLPQFARRAELTATAAGEGMFLVAVGLFKKVVISEYLHDNLVKRVVDAPTSFSAVETLFGMFGYAVQIYCDFSGYSDIAIGVALLLGYRLKINFDAPFKSSNLVEFWRRWHISLSSWLRDYIYIPLGGSRIVRDPASPSAPLRRTVSKAMVAGALAFFAGWALVFVTRGALIKIATTRGQSVPEGRFFDLLTAMTDTAPEHQTSHTIAFLAGSAVLLLGLFLADSGRKYLNVWITMVVCGIWHGANWNYVIFGVVQGLAVGLSHFYFDLRKKRPADAGDGPVPITRIHSVIATFLFTTFTFILIVAPIDKAVLIYRQLLTFSTYTPNLHWQLYALIGLGLFLQWMPKKLYLGARDVFIRFPAPVQAAALFVLAVFLRQVASAESLPFAYGQF